MGRRVIAINDDGAPAFARRYFETAAAPADFIEATCLSLHRTELMHRKRLMMDGTRDKIDLEPIKRLRLTQPPLQRARLSSPSSTL